jgi:cytochrome c
MDSFEFNKFAGAVLFSVLLILAVGTLSETLFATKPANEKSFVVDVPEAGSSAAPKKEEKATPLPVLLAQADVAKGEKTAKVCTACHNLKEGAGAKIGPDLYHVVGRKVATFPGFSYSDALQKIGGTWTFDDLFHFLKSPKDYAPGTAMGFAGIKNDQKRADVIAYLNTLGSNLPLPEVKKEAPADGGDAAAPADAGKGDAAPADAGGEKKAE